ncbi:hypothetical protein [Defluviitalea saccharophila]|uniref:Apea-like HEPN domain-containing protein n=1 Tax=Defluviitalea saccharophila TaxID=879970 RepID=A0ABZ2Y9D5_9FIRM
MPTLFPVHKRIPPVLIPNYSQQFIFPISGMKLKNDEFITIGCVKFVNRNYLLSKYKGNFESFKVDAFAIVDISKHSSQKKYDEGYNSLALKILKEVIGYLNILVYKKYGLRIERKVMISNIPEQEIDDGFTIYISCTDDECQIHNNISLDLTLTKDGIQTFLDKKEWNSYFEISFESRNEIQKRIGKALEYLYYIFNEIYTNERVIKYFIVLNHLIRRDYKTDLNCHGIESILNFFFYEYKLIEVTKELKNYKFSTSFLEMYARLRNNILHGILDVEKEETPINEEDYYFLKRIVMELLIVLVEDSKINKFDSMKEIYEFTNEYRTNKKQRNS